MNRQPSEVLYYPSIEFYDDSWLKGALCHWDKVFRIVPPSYRPHDSDEVKEAIDAGSKIPPGLVESLKRDHKPQKVITDYGWTSDGEIWVAIKLSETILRSGVFSIPSGMKTFIQGEFALKAADGAAISALKIRDCSGWNLSSFFTRRGGEAGDYLVLLFNLKDRVVRVQLGDISLLDDFIP